MGFGTNFFVVAIIYKFFFYFLGNYLEETYIYIYKGISILRNARLNQDQTLLMRSYFRMKKEHFGGMHIVIGHDIVFMVQLLFCRKRKPVIHSHNRIEKKFLYLVCKLFLVFLIFFLN